MINQTKAMKTRFSANWYTFEQYRNVDVSLGLTASHDDLRTDGSASAALQNKRNLQ